MTDNPSTETPRDLARLPKPLLAARCRAAGLEAHGTKAELMGRLTLGLVGDAETMGRDAWIALNTRRLNAIYESTYDSPFAAMKSVAVMAIEKLNRLLDLYGDAPGEAESEEDVEAASERRRTENEHLALLVDAVEAHLEPLGLSASLEDTDADLVRLAAERIRALEAKTKTKKKPSTQRTQRTQRTQKKKRGK